MSTTTQQPTYDQLLGVCRTQQAKIKAMENDRIFHRLFEKVMSQRAVNYNAGDKGYITLLASMLLSGSYECLDGFTRISEMDIRAKNGNNRGTRASVQTLLSQGLFDWREQGVQPQEGMVWFLALPGNFFARLVNTEKRHNYNGRPVWCSRCGKDVVPIIEITKLVEKVCPYCKDLLSDPVLVKQSFQGGAEIGVKRVTVLDRLNVPDGVRQALLHQQEEKRKQVALLSHLQIQKRKHL